MPVRSSIAGAPGRRAHSLAQTASRRWELADRCDVIGLAEEFADTLRAELDYVREGESAARIAASFAGDPAVHIPRVYQETTGTRVLTLERLYGIKIDDLAALDAAGIDRVALATRSSQIIMKMIFEDGFFHADPHPGNFFIEPNGRIGLIDFGMTGTVDDRTCEQLIDVLLALAGNDTSRPADACLALGVARGHVDRLPQQRSSAHSRGRPTGAIRASPRYPAPDPPRAVRLVLARRVMQIPSDSDRGRSADQTSPNH